MSFCNDQSIHKASGFTCLVLCVLSLRSVEILQGRKDRFCSQQQKFWRDRTKVTVHIGVFFSTFDKFNLDFPYIFYYTCVIKSLPAVHLTGICVGFSTCCMASFMNCLPSFTALAI